MLRATQRYAGLVRRYYSAIIVSTLLVAVAVGALTGAPGRTLMRFNVPLVAVMIGAMGFTIPIRALGLALRDWKGVSFGLALNFLLAPAICWVVATILLSGHPHLATGMILIGVVPCAGMALVWVGLLEGDVPLATVINTATMFLAPIAIPVLMPLLAGGFVQIDAWVMLKNALLTILFPVIIGVLLRDLLDRRMDTRPIVPAMPAVSATMAVLLMFMAVNTSTKMVMGNLGLVPPLIVSTLVVFPTLFAVSFWMSLRLFPRNGNVAITYSAGMKNLPIALGIASVSFGKEEGGLEMLTIAVAFAFQMLTAVSFYQYLRRSHARFPKENIEGA